MASCRIPLLCLLGLLLLVASPAIAADDSGGIYYQLALLVRTGATYFFTCSLYVFCTTVSIINRDRSYYQVNSVTMA